jgi:hypothetical protein
VPSDTDLILVTSASGRRNVALEATNASSIIAQRVFVPGLLVAILAWGFGVMLLEASKNLFWYDEIVTFHISGLQPFSLLLKALKAGADAQPLGYYLIARAANMLPGDPLVTLRLPSILGYLMTLLGGLLVCAEKTAGNSRSGGRDFDRAVSAPRVRPGRSTLRFAGRFFRDIRGSLAEDRREAVHDAAVRFIPNFSCFVSRLRRCRNFILCHS